MLALTARQSLILELLREQGSCPIAALASRLDVSLETIRRDVKPLVAARELVKRHGAVALPHALGEAPFERRMREHAEAKRAIARHAARLIADGDSLMIDNGTTTSYFARELLKRRSLTVVTNSSDVARTLATVNGNRVYMAGGELNGANGGAFGPSAIAFAASFRVRHAVISIAAVDAGFGLSDHDLAEAEFARTVLACGERRMVLTDSGKFGRVALIRVGGLGDADLLVTEQPPPPALREAMSAANLHCDVAPA
jgi:DeoR family glycerol-3-phosphate regulon repressor